MPSEIQSTTPEVVETVDTQNEYADMFADTPEAFVTEPEETDVSPNEEQLESEEEVTPETEETVDPVEGESVDEVTEEEVETPQVEAPESKSNEAFARLRVENKKNKDIIEKAARLAGLSVDDFAVKLAEDEIKKGAEEAKIPVEVFQRIKDLEESNRATEFERHKLQFQTTVRNFQSQVGLSDTDLNGFISQMMDAGITPHETEIDFNILYRGLNHDKLVESERQKWIAKQTRNQDKTSTPGSSKGETSPEEGVEIKTFKDFDNLMKGMTIK